jgi:hypothetical protein
VRRRILVVSENLALANRLMAWLKDAGHDPAIVTSFCAGKDYLRTAPDALIAELKLREYNGLHLALRARCDGIPAAVIGGDPRFADDAHEIGVSYLVGDNVDRDDILLLIEALLSAKQPTPLELRKREGPYGPADPIDQSWSADPMGRAAPPRSLIH